MEVTGARTITLAPNGDLAIHAGTQNILLKKPVAYQEVGDSRRKVQVRYRLKRNTFTFDLGPYDHRRLRTAHCEPPETCDVSVKATVRPRDGRIHSLNVRIARTSR